MSRKPHGSRRTTPLKLTREDVIAIRSSKELLRVLAVRHNISTSTAERVRSRKLYKWIDEPLEQRT